MKCLHKLNIFYLGAFALLFFCFPISSFAALGSSPAGFDVEVMEGGERFQELMIVRSGDTSSSVILDVRFRGDSADYFLGESQHVIPAGSDRASYTLRISPKDLLVGNYSAQIDFITRIQDLPVVSSSGSVVSNRTGVTVSANFSIVTGEFLSFEILDVRMSSIEVGVNPSVNFVIKNKGNISWSPEGINVVIRNSDGEVVYDQEIVGEFVEVLAGKTDKQNIKLSKILPEGEYNVTVDIYDDGEVEYDHFQRFYVYPKGTFEQKGKLTLLGSDRKIYSAFQDINMIGSFENTGDTAYDASMVFDVFKGNRLVYLFRTEPQYIDPGEEIVFRHTFSPRISGDYRVVGLIEYGNRVTPPRKIDISVLPAKLPTAFWVLLGLLIVTFGIWAIARKDGDNKHRPKPPVVSEPVLAGVKKIVGTSLSSDGSIIEIRLDGRFAGRATVLNGQWSLTFSASLKAGSEISTIVSNEANAKGQLKKKSIVSNKSRGVIVKAS